MKKFLVKEAIDGVLLLSKIRKNTFIYSIKIDLPEELTLHGNKIIFQGILFKLLEKAKQAYATNNFQNKIILVTAKVEGANIVSFSVTHGGRSLSFFEKTIKTPNIFFFREQVSKFNFAQIHQVVKKEFKGKVIIISKKEKGSTFKCFFPLNR